MYLIDIDLFRQSVVVFFSLCEPSANCVFQEIGPFHLGHKMCVRSLSQFSFSYSYMAFWFLNFSTIKNHYHYSDFKSTLNSFYYIIISLKIFFISLYLHICFLGGAGDKELACQSRRHKRLRYDSWVGKILWWREW